MWNNHCNHEHFKFMNNDKSIPNEFDNILSINLLYIEIFLNNFSSGTSFILEGTSICIGDKTLLLILLYSISAWYKKNHLHRSLAQCGKRTVQPASKMLGPAVLTKGAKALQNLTCYCISVGRHQGKSYTLYPSFLLK